MSIHISPRYQATHRQHDGVPALVLIGRQGDDATPRGAWFGKDEVKQARSAAAQSGLDVVSIRSKTLSELAHRVPRGRIFSSGKAFAPRIQTTVYDALAGHARPAKAKTQSVSGQKAAAGPLMASSGGSAPKPGSTGAGSGGGGAGSSSGGGGDRTGSGQAKPHMPESWSQIRVGSKVLAAYDHDDGWWPAYVTALKGDGVFELRWEDEEDPTKLVCRRDQLALMHPDFTGDLGVA